MTDDPIHTLERELVAAARRAADQPAPQAAATAPARHHRRLVRRGLLAGAVLVPVLAVLAVVLAVHTNSGDSTSSDRPTVGAAPSTVLGVLRRPGVAPGGQALSVMQRVARTVRDPTVTLEHASLRELSVTVAPGDSVPLDLAIVRAADGRQLIGLTVPAHSASGQGNSSMMYSYADKASEAYATVAELRNSGVSTWLGPDRGGAEDYAVLVPDGVTRVRLDAPGEPVAAVHDNVAGFRLANASPDNLSKQLGMTWLGASGQVVHRVSGLRLPSPAQLRAHVNTAVRSLRAHLAVLRRPSDAADRARRTALLDTRFPGTTVVGSSVRVARTTKEFGTVVVAVARETSNGTAGILTSDRHGSGCCTTPHQLLSRGGLSSSSARGGDGEALVVVPDGVRSVALHLTGRTTRAPVINNIAIMPASGGPSFSLSMTWYGADGTVIRQVPALK